jgi:hypothetical protein
MTENGETRSGWLFTKLLMNPKKAFEEIAAAPAFLRPALVLTGINLIIGIAIAPKIKAFTVWMMEHGPVSIPQEQLEQALGVASTAVVVSSIAGSVFIPWLIWLLVAGLLKIFAMFSAKETPFKTLFAVAVYGYLPIFVGLVITAAITLSVPVQNLQNVSVSLAALLPPQKGFLYFFLTQCSPFTWWSLILWGIGGAAAMGIRFTGTILYMFGLWIAQAVATAAFSAISAPPGMP